MDDKARISAYSIAVGLLVGVGLPVVDWLTNDVLRIESPILKGAVVGVLVGAGWYFFHGRWRRGQGH